MSQSTAALPAEINTSNASLFGWYGVVLLFLALVLAAPIWAVQYPPLVDYPNHLARGYILYHYDDVPSFRTYYEVDYLSTPSLAMDLFMLALQPIFDIRIVGKLFLTLTLWLWLLGWHLVGHALHGRPTWLALGAALVAYHSMFFYGFTNFSFSLGVFLIALAAWFYGRAHWPWPRHLLIALLALACFFSHLSAFIFLAGSVLAITAWECVRAKTISWAAIINVLPIFVPFVFFRSSGGDPPTWNWPGKLVGAVSLFRGYHEYVDGAFILAVAIFLVLLFLWSTRTRAVGSVLFVGLGCVVMFLIGPHMLFGGAPADARFLLPAAALVTLPLDFCYPPKKALALLIFFLALVLFRIGMIACAWQQIDADLGRQVALFENFPQEAKVYPIVKVSDRPDEKKRELPSFHLIGYAVINRRIYVPTLISFQGHNPLRYKDPPPRITEHADPAPFPPVDKVHWSAVFANHDYLWCCRLPDDYRAFLEKHCTLVAEDGVGSVWRVRRDGRNP